MRLGSAIAIALAVQVCAAVLVENQGPIGADAQSNILKMKMFTPASKSIFKVDNFHGFVPVDDDGGDIFYWLFPAKNDPANAPLLVWFTGGPGCSSELAVMFENGPFNVTLQGEVILNDYSWNDKANLLYIDQPVGTGFSHSKTRGLVKTEEEVAATMVRFFDSFFKDIFPEFQKRKFFLSGESFAGNYLPHIANALFNAQREYINLQGIAIGNGWTDPAVQYPAYADYAIAKDYVSFTKFSQADYDRLMPQIRSCSKLLTSSPPYLIPTINDWCQSLSDQISNDPAGNPKFNVYDIRKPCITDMCYDMTAMTAFMNSAAVRTELQVDKSWQPCDGKVGDFFNLLDGNANAGPKLTQLLDAQIPVLVYSGDHDYACNWYGGMLWTNQLKWAGQPEFAKAQMVPEKDYGEAKSYKNFKFLRVFESGHMVPLDRPKDALDMINGFMGFA